MGKIIDQYGNPIKSEQLIKPFAPPTLGSVRSVISGHPANGLTPNRLAAILQNAAAGDHQAYFELAEDMEERDLHYSAVLSTRKRQVAQLPITIDAASDDKEHVKHADFIRSWIDKGILRSALIDILDAIGKGFSVTEIIWSAENDTWVPKKLIGRPQQWFNTMAEDGETLVLREHGQELALPSAQFIIHRHSSKSGLTVRGGLARVAAWAWMYKSYTLKDWAIFVQNFGMPIRIGKYGNNAKPEEIDILWKAVKNIAGDMAAIIPENMLVEFIDLSAKGTVVDLYERRCDWFDRQISKLVLGQTTTTDAVSGGHAVAKEHRLVQEDIERSDAAILSATINQQLIPNIIAFNFGEQQHYPKINIGRPDEVPLDQIIMALEKTSITVEASWLRDRLGAPDPSKDAELVGGRNSSAQALFDQADQKTPQLNVGQSALNTLQSRFNRNAPEPIIDHLVKRVEDDTAGIIAGLTEDIRNVIMTSETFSDMSQRLLNLNLDASDLAEAMTKGMALSHLVGQAALIDEITKSK